MIVDLRHGDCVELMRGMPEKSVDSIVTDPPYELGFMGKAWDGAGIAYSLDMWREALRVLKPGGHLLAFGGTRTYHRMVCAIEDAGFEIRDSIHWVYGSGFPKSLNISKAIDKAAGAKREVVGERTLYGTAASTNPVVGSMEGVSGSGATKQVPVTVSATDEARRWEGWGTALKPAHEPVVVARKPLSGTVAGNVVAWGTGGLNIDGCRVGTDGGTYNSREALPSPNGIYGDGLNGGKTLPLAAGRWPANIVFSHSTDCVPSGTRQVQSNKPVKWQRAKSDAERTATSYAAPTGDAGEVRGAYGDDTGYETVRAFDCAADCPVAALDKQSGVSKDGVAVNRNRPDEGSRHEATSYHITMRRSPNRGYGGSGGASRFFTQADWGPDDWPFVYQAKPSRRERNAGLDGLPERETLIYSEKAQGPLPQQTPSKPSPRANHHPTVKPVALMRHLVRIVTPPGGTVLDPFAGSGTTLVAAVLEGFDAIGCEMTDEYLPIIRGRVAWAQEQAFVREELAKSQPEQPTLL